MRIFIALFFIILSINTYAFRYAYTTNDKTLVYADKKLEVPIGYIRSGRKVKVGDKSYNKFTMTTIMVAGRVAFIKTEDLTFDLEGNKLSSAPAVKEHDIETLFQTDEDKLSENNYISFELSQFGSGDEWKELNQRLSGTEIDGAITVFTLKVEHRSPKKRSGFSIGANYAFASETKVKMQTLLLDYEYQYRIFQSKLFSLEGLGAIMATGELEITTRDGEVSNGVAYGYRLGARARFFTFSRLGFYGTLETMNLWVKSMDPITTNDINDFTLGSFSGVKMTAGLSIQL